MAKRGKRGEATAVAGPAPHALAAAIALGALQSLWSLFQWMQLVLARRGLDSFCGFGEGGSCADLWDSSFAHAVFDWTGLPVAAWGLVWGASAFALSLASLVRAASGRPAGAAWSATLLCALAGLLGVGLLGGVSLASRQLCTTCLLTYALVLAFTVVCLRESGWRPPVSTLRAAPLAIAVAGLAFLALLYPGLQTPRSADQTARSLLGEATGHNVPRRGEHGEAPPRADARPPAPGIAQLVRGLPEPAQEAFRDSLAGYRANPALPMRPPRALEGAPDAPLRITEFTDVLCGHCATLHDSLEEMRARLGAGAFALESRQFPLDAACNPQIPGESTKPVRCLAARAQICIESDPGAFEFAGALFDNQQSLDEARVYELAEPYMRGPDLERCVRAADTEAKLQDDIAWAMEHDIRGTPLVLLNGRVVPNFPPLLYALVMSKGDVESLDAPAP